MASDYAYTTVANLEAIHTDYSVVDADYVDAFIDGIISQAERWVNEYCGKTFTGTIPDGVVFATLEMARFLMNRQMLEDAHLKELPTKLSQILQLCKTPLAKNKVKPTYSGSATDFYLPNREG